MPSNRKSRAAEQRRLPEPSDKTVIIPQITPELLEQRRREAVRRSQTITRSTPPAPQPAPEEAPAPAEPAPQPPADKQEPSLEDTLRHLPLDELLRDIHDL